jgi:hypothetical protein
MQVEDVEMVRTVRREMARHQIDASMTSVSAHHGVIHLYGMVRPLRGHEQEFESEMIALYKCLRQRPGVRELIAEWSAEGYNLSEMSKQRARS